MLLLTRRVGQSIAIEDGRIRLMITYIGRDEVTIGIEANKGIPVHRAEVQRRIERERKETANASCE